MFQLIVILLYFNGLCDNCFCFFTADSDPLSIYSVCFGSFVVVTLRPFFNPVF